MTKRIIALAIALWLFSATFAFAVWTPPISSWAHVQSYNPSFGQSIRILPQGFTIKYSHNACGALVVTVQDTFFGVPVGEPRVTEFTCP